MKYKLNDDELEIIKSAEEVTRTDYGIREKYILIECLISVIEDLLSEVAELKERYNELENDLEENYSPIPYEEQL